MMWFYKSKLFREILFSLFKMMANYHCKMAMHYVNLMKSHNRILKEMLE